MIKTIALKIGHFLFHNRDSKVIFYHDITGLHEYTDMGTPLALFQSHIGMIEKEKFEIVREIKQPKDQIQLCFDDGFYGIYDYRMYLQEKNIKPTVFLAISLIGKDGYLSEEEIRVLQDMGFRFQSHSVSHQNLTLFSDKDLKYELEHSKSTLEEKLGQPVDEICFPIGYFSERVINACLAAGYTKLYTSLPGSYGDRLAKSLVYRNLVQFLSPAEFKATLYGGMTLLRSLYMRKHFVKKDY